MRYGDRVEGDLRRPTAISLTGRARGALRAMAEAEGVSASAIIERWILASSTRGSGIEAGSLAKLSES